MTPVPPPTQPPAPVHPVPPPAPEDPPPRPRGWLRRNAVALVAAAVALVVATTVIVVVPLQRSAPKGPERVVAAGESFTWHGRTISLRAAGTDGKAGSTIETPTGSGLIAVLIRVKAASDAPQLGLGFCEIQLTVPGPWLGDDREWSPESSPSDYRYGVDYDNDSQCLLEKPESKLIENVFLVPKGTYQKAFLDLEFHEKGKANRLIRFALPSKPTLF